MRLITVSFTLAIIGATAFLAPLKSFFASWAASVALVSWSLAAVLLSSMLASSGATAAATFLMALPLRVTSSLFRRTRSPVAAAWELSAPASARRRSTTSFRMSQVTCRFTAMALSCCSSAATARSFAASISFFHSGTFAAVDAVPSAASPAAAAAAAGHATAAWRAAAARRVPAWSAWRQGTSPRRRSGSQPASWPSGGSASLPAAPSPGASRGTSRRLRAPRSRPREARAGARPNRRASRRSPPLGAQQLATACSCA
mmetsp:Transcript_13608/g.29479  ORF Transcript_13608/g.29479 Transcript_13608/m.29479 type:complete len:259 (+) Transcript_13608:536-1312(+)